MNAFSEVVLSALHRLPQEKPNLRRLLAESEKQEENTPDDEVIER